MKIAEGYLSWLEHVGLFMHLNFTVKSRIPIPPALNPDLQNLFIFNMYRAGSSVVEATAEALAKSTGRVPLNLTQILYNNNIEYFDVKNYQKPSMFLDAGGKEINQLTQFGGYVIYGFREVPFGFGEEFNHVLASVLIARDVRDIGISHYSAVKKHSMENAIIADHISALREIVSRESLHEYILSDATVQFLSRISLCYETMISKGTPVIQYENLYRDGAFSLEMLCERLYEHFRPFAGPNWSLEAFTQQTLTRVNNSKSLKGHATQGMTRAYEELPVLVRRSYRKKLERPLQVLGYV